MAPSSWDLVVALGQVPVDFVVPHASGFGFDAIPTFVSHGVASVSFREASPQSSASKGCDLFTSIVESLTPIIMHRFGVIT